MIHSIFWWKYLQKYYFLNSDENSKTNKLKLITLKWCKINLSLWFFWDESMYLKSYNRLMIKGFMFWKSLPKQQKLLFWNSKKFRTTNSLKFLKYFFSPRCDKLFFLSDIIGQSLKRSILNDNKTILLYLVFWKNNRFCLTLQKSIRIILTLTYRRGLHHSLQVLNEKTRWLIQTFFLFKFWFFFISIQIQNVLLIFLNFLSTILLYSLQIFQDNLNFFLKICFFEYIYFYFPNKYFFTMQTFKKIKSVKKFRLKNFKILNNQFFINLGR